MYFSLSCVCVCARALSFVNTLPTNRVAVRVWHRCPTANAQRTTTTRPSSVGSNTCQRFDASIVTGKNPPCCAKPRSSDSSWKRQRSASRRIASDTASQAPTSTSPSASNRLYERCREWRRELVLGWAVLCGIMLSPIRNGTTPQPCHSTTKSNAPGDPTASSEKRASFHRGFHASSSYRLVPFGSMA